MSMVVYGKASTFNFKFAKLMYNNKFGFIISDVFLSILTNSNDKIIDKTQIIDKNHLLNKKHLYILIDKNQIIILRTLIETKV